MRLKKFPQAEPLLAELYPLTQGDGLPRAASPARCAENYGLCLLRLHRYEQAEPVLLAAADRRAGDAAALARWRDLASGLVELYDATDRPEQARAWRQKLADAARVTTSPATAPASHR
jgi:hypothetical protein